MKVGVIGTGSMGENHVRTYSSLSEFCQLIGIYDANEKRACEIADKYQTKMFSSIDELLREVDLVSIAVPTPYHYEVGLACIRHKVHMLMEKPIAGTISEAKSLVEKATKSGVKIQVGHIELYNPLISILKNVIRDEKVIALDIHRMNPFDPRVSKSDVVQDLMIHDLYILKELINKEITDVYAFGNEINGPQHHAVALLKFENGITGQLTASFRSEEKIRTIRIITENGLIKANLLEQKIEVIRSLNHYMKKEIGQIHGKVVEHIDIPRVEPLKIQLIDFIQCVKKSTTPYISAEDGIEALTLATKISDVITKDGSGGQVP